MSSDLPALEEQTHYNRLLSQLAHIEIFTPRLADSVEFWTQVLGLQETTREGSSVYLRAWGDPFHHSLILTEGEEPGLGHIGWRTAGPDQLKTAVERLEKGGYGEGWIEDSIGHGAAYRFHGPGGHIQEVFWEVDRHQPAEDRRSVYPERYEKFDPRGAAVRMLDHVTVATADIMTDVGFHRDVLGSRFSGYTLLDDDPDQLVFATMTSMEKAHDLGLLGDSSGIPGRVHHLCYWLESFEDVFTAADVIIEAGHEIEWGPGRHGIGEMAYLYFREPGGMRIELDSGGSRIYAPDEPPTRWMPLLGSNDFYRTSVVPESMYEVFPASDQRVLISAGGRSTNR